MSIAASSSAETFRPAFAAVCTAANLSSADALALFDPVWAEMTPREQARVVSLLVEQVVYDGTRGRVTITFAPSGIKTLAEELADKHLEQRA